MAKLRRLEVQNRWLEWTDVMKADLTWRRLIFGMSDKELKFTLQAITNTAISPDNLRRWNCAQIDSTVKPVLSDHPTVQGKMVVWTGGLLNKVSPETDRFFEALLNSCERCGANALDLRNDNSRRSDPTGGLMR